MKLSPILLGGLLAISATSTAFAGQKESSTETAVGKKALTFKCQTRGSSVTVVLKPNLKYNATSTVSTTPTMGNYVIAAGPAYRFKTGGLKDSSIVKQAGNFYLVATINEAKAAQLAASDGALFCQ